MKILQLLGHGGVGGTETFVMSLTQGLIDRGHDVTMVNTWTDSPLNAAARHAGIPFVALAGGGRRTGPRWFWTVYRYLKENRFDIIHAYGLRMSLGLRLMQNHLKVRRHVMGVRGLDQHRTRLGAMYDRRTERLVHLVVCNSQAVAQKRVATTGTPRSRLRVIPNGIDPDQFTPDLQPSDRASLGLPDGFLFVMVASFRFEKDHGNLLEAIKVAGERLAGATFVLVGDGALRDEVATQARWMELSRKILFLGAVSDVRPILKACDAFVLSSHSEGMPRALMEAMAVGMPVVSTTAGGVPEVAEHECHALLVPTRAPAALADAMSRIMKDVALRQRLGLAAAERIRTEFTHVRMLDRHEEMYHSLCETLSSEGA